MVDNHEQNELWVDDIDEIVTVKENSEPMELIVDEPELAGEIEVEDEDWPAEMSGEQVYLSSLPEPDYQKDQLKDLTEQDAIDKTIIFVEEKVPGSDAALKEDEDNDGAVEQQKTDWAKDGDHSKFIDYVVDKKNKIPRHSGETIPGCERAKSFLKSLDVEISKAMRTDLDGTIDEQQVDAIRKDIEDMVEKLDRQIGKLKKKTKKADLEVRLVSEGTCDKCNCVAPMWHNVAENKVVCMHCEADLSEKDETLEKKANTPILNVYVTAFERAIVGILINSTVSGGHNIEETYNKLKGKYRILPREELAIQQLLSDSGFPYFKDRGLLDEPSNPAEGNGVDFQSNYQA